MPRYLGINYLADALRQRRAMLSQMLLTIPSDLEYLEIYSNRRTMDKLNSFCLEKEAAFKLSSKLPIDYLKQLTSYIQHPESYNLEIAEDNIIPSSNPDSPLESFNVWNELKEKIENHLINSLVLYKEHFTSITENLYDNSAQDKLEEMECVDNLYEALHQIPKVKNLCSKLKTKLVQDPLVLDNDGNPLEERNVLRAELRFPLDQRSEEGPKFIAKEIFAKITLKDEVSEVKSTVEHDEIESIISPVIPPSKRLPYLTEVQRLLELQQHSESEEIPELRLQGDAFDEVLAFADDTEKELKDNEVEKADFVALNHDKERCEDPFKDGRMLESPAQLPSVALKDDTSKKFINSLETFELSPGTQSPPITPNKATQCVQNIWESEKLLFSEHLAMVFPVPSTSAGRNKHRNMNLVELATKKLVLSQECLNGKLELGLPWDPFAISAVRMEKCQRNLQRFSEFSEQEKGNTLALHRTRWLCKSGETFQKTCLHEAMMTTPTEMHDTTPKTFDTPKCRASSSRVCLTAASIAQENENKSELPVIPSTSTTSFKQMSSGLEDFLSLRTGKLDSQTSSYHTHNLMTPGKTVRAAKIRPSVFTKDTRSELHPNALTNPSKSTRECQMQQKDVAVKLTDEFQNVLDEVIRHINPLLARLQDSEVIPAAKTMSTLNPDYTRLVLKQAQMSLRERDENTKKKQIYCMTVCLHAMVSSADILVNSGLEAAIAYLSATQEKYGSLLGEALEPTRRYLFETHFTFHQRNILHPKLSKLLTIAAQWSKGQDADHERAAIITYSFPEKLHNEILETLSGLQGIQAKLFKPAADMNEFQEVDALLVYLISALDIGEDFPWGSFDHVLDYDLTTTIRRVELPCTSKLKSRTSLRTIAKALRDDQTAFDLKGSDAQVREKQDQFIFIGSEKITKNVDLLHLLETRHSVLIYERRYSNLKPRDSLSKMYLQPDLMVDERTCIHVQHLDSVVDEGECEELRDTVLSLSLKCQKCFIIVLASKQSHYTFTGEVLRHLSVLFASFAHFQDGQFEMEILYSFSVAETAKLIRQLGERTRAHSSVWSKPEWTKRKWLTNEASAHETFLLSIPCLNSFSAQVMLTAAPLAELLKLSPEELKETCPWIPRRTITEFHKSITWCSELDSNVKVHSSAQGTWQSFQQCNQLSSHTPFLGESPPCRMTSDFDSTLGSIATNAFRPGHTKIEPALDYGRELLKPFSEQGNIRDVATYKDCYQHSWDYTGVYHGKLIEGSTSETFQNNLELSSFNNCLSNSWMNRDDADFKGCDQKKMRRELSLMEDGNNFQTLMRKRRMIVQRLESRTSLGQRVKSVYQCGSGSVNKLNVITKRVVRRRRRRTGIERAITDSRDQVSQHPQLKADQPLFTNDICSSQEMCGSMVSSVPGNFSKGGQLSQGDTGYLAMTKQQDIKQPFFFSLSNPLGRVGGSPMCLQRPEAESQLFPEIYWKNGDLSQKYESDRYPHLHVDHPQGIKTSVERMGKDPSYRKRQAVRVLDLGNESSLEPPTKVGIAQPQRRRNGPVYQVLGDNSVASQHKRFSLGIDRSTHPLKEPPSRQPSKGEEDVPSIRPCLAKSNEWSTLPSYLSSKSRKLTYEKIPGMESGQTKLVFKYDL